MVDPRNKNRFHQIQPNQQPIVQAEGPSHHRQIRTTSQERGEPWSQSYSLIINDLREIG